MKKKILSLTVALATALSMVPASFADAATPSVRVDDRAITFSDQEPVMRDSRVLVPARGVFEAMDAKVTWNAEKRSVTVDSYDNITRLVLRIDDAVMDVYTFTSLMHADKAELELDVPPQIINNRTMIPLRAVSESLQATVDWVDDARLVDITTAQYKKYIAAYETENTTTYDAKTILPNIYLTADKDTVKAGDVVTLSVCISNTAALSENLSFTGLSAAIFYDAEQFDCGEYTALYGGAEIETPLGGSNPAFENNSVKLIYITNPTETYALTDSVIATIPFQAKKDGPATFVLSDRITSLGYDTILMFADADRKNMSIQASDELFIDTTPIELQ